ARLHRARGLNRAVGLAPCVRARADAAAVPGGLREPARSRARGLHHRPRPLAPLLPADGAGLGTDAGGTGPDPAGLSLLPLSPPRAAERECRRLGHTRGALSRRAPSVPARRAAGRWRRKVAPGKNDWDGEWLTVRRARSPGLAARDADAALPEKSSRGSAPRSPCLPISRARERVGLSARGRIGIATRPPPFPHSGRSQALRLGTPSAWTARCPGHTRGV